MSTATAKGFTADAVLVARARKLIDELPAKRWRDREALHDRLHELTLAAEMSRGPLPERNAKWAETALHRQGKLRQLVDQVEGMKR